MQGLDFPYVTIMRPGLLNRGGEMRFAEKVASTLNMMYEHFFNTFNFRFYLPWNASLNCSRSYGY